jgi:hypothetical protein
MRQVVAFHAVDISKNPSLGQCDFTLVASEDLGMRLAICWPLDYIGVADSLRDVSARGGRMQKNKQHRSGSQSNSKSVR